MDERRDVFFLSRRGRRACWFVVLVFPLAVAWFVAWAWMERAGLGIGIPWWLYALSALAHGFAWTCFAWGLLHRSRPVVAVSEREVEWGSVFSFTGRRRAIPIDEIRSVAWKNPRHLRVETRSLGCVEIRVAEVDKEERKMIHDAISRHICRP